jgi:hypothetical protein
MKARSDPGVRVKRSPCFLGSTEPPPRHSKTTGDAPQPPDLTPRKPSKILDTHQDRLAEREQTLLAQGMRQIIERLR